MAASYSGRERCGSMFSIRSNRRPSSRRASASFSSAEKAWPRCSSPFGLGAKRKTGAPLRSGPDISNAPAILRQVLEAVQAFEALQGDVGHVVGFGEPDV